MRTGAQALRVAMSRPEIPFAFVGTDGQPRTVGDLMCMRAVLANFDLIPIDGFPTANRGWRISQGKNNNDRHPPAGAPVWFPNPRIGSSGHVAIATGVRALAWTTPVYLTDKQRYTTSHLSTIASLEILSGNTYAGWTSFLGDHQIDFGTTTAAGFGFSMMGDELTKEEMAQILGAINESSEFMRRESRYRLYRNLSTNEVIALNINSGDIMSGEVSVPFWTRLKLVAKSETIFPLSAVEFGALVDRAAVIRKKAAKIDRTLIAVAVRDAVAALHIEGVDPDVVAAAVAAAVEKRLDEE